MTRKKFFSWSLSLDYTEPIGIKTHNYKKYYEFKKNFYIMLKCLYDKDELTDDIYSILGNLYMSDYKFFTKMEGEGESKDIAPSWFKKFGLY